jgi:hypothetical protein
MIEMLVVCWATLKCWTSHGWTTGVMFKAKIWLTLKLTTHVYNHKFLDTHTLDSEPNDNNYIVFSQPIDTGVSDSQATRIYWFPFETQALNIGVIDNEIVT